MQLYHHQIEAIKQIANHSKGVFIGTCGCGKTQIYKVAARSVRSTLILVPRKLLVDQFYEQYFQNDSEFDVVRVNSDQKEGSKNQRQVDNVFWDRFQNKELLAERPMVALVNYQSLARLNRLRGNTKFDIVFNDEAHNINIKEGCGHKEDVSFQHDLGSKSFYFTATPTEALLHRSDVYGPILWNYDFASAVADGIVKRFITHIECLRSDKGKISNPATPPPLLWSLGQFVLRHNLKRIIVYTNRVKDTLEADEGGLGLGEEEEEEQREENQPTDHLALIAKVRASMSLARFKKESHFLPRQIKAEYITAATTLEQRYHMFHRFRDEADEGIRMIVSCRTISEGIDLTSCDGVILLDSGSNNIITTQRILRCTRLTQKERDCNTWNPATVLIPFIEHTPSSFQEDQTAQEWLERFASGLHCRFERKSNVLGPESNRIYKEVLELQIGDNLEDTPYDPRALRDDPLRETVKHQICKKLPFLTPEDVYLLEEGIFLYTMTHAITGGVKQYARNWDAPRFKTAYKRRARTVLFNLNRKTLEDIDELHGSRLKLFASTFGASQMAPDLHAKFYEWRQKAYLSDPNGTIDSWANRSDAQKAHEELSGGQKQKPPRTGIACKRGCLREKQTRQDDPDFGWRVTYRERQMRSSDEPMTIFYYCNDCRVLWKE